MQFLKYFSKSSWAIFLTVLFIYYINMNALAFKWDSAKPEMCSKQGALGVLFIYLLFFPFVCSLYGFLINYFFEKNVKLKKVGLIDSGTLFIIALLFLVYNKSDSLFSIKYNLSMRFIKDCVL